jgi:hypothetical protein
VEAKEAMMMEIRSMLSPPITATTIFELRSPFHTYISPSITAFNTYAPSP